MSGFSKAPLRDVQALRGIAAAMVMCYHAGTITAMTTGTLLFGNLFRGGFLGLDVFFMLSGFVMYWTHAKDFGHPGNLGVFVKKRVVRIFPIYWVIVLAKAVKEGFQGNYLALICAVFLIPYPQIPFITVSWTLSYELFFYIALGAMIVLPKGLWTLLPPGALLMFSVLPAPEVSGTGFAATLLLFPFNPHLIEFLMGLLVGWCASRQKFSPAWGRRFLWAGGIAFIGIYAVATGLSMDSSLQTTPGEAYRLAELGGNLLFDMAIWLLAVPLGATLLGLVLCEVNSGKSKIPSLNWLGDISYSLYLIHGFVIHYLMQRGEVANYVSQHHWAIFGPIAMAIGLATVVHYLLEKPLMVYTKSWVAGRRLT